MTRQTRRSQAQNVGNRTKGPSNKARIEFQGSTTTLQHASDGQDPAIGPSATNQRGLLLDNMSEKLLIV